MIMKKRLFELLIQCYFRSNSWPLAYLVYYMLYSLAIYFKKLLFHALSFIEISRLNED